MFLVQFLIYFLFSIPLKDRTSISSSKGIKKNSKLSDSRNSKIMKKRHESQNKYCSNLGPLSSKHLKYEVSNSTRNNFISKSNFRTTQKSMTPENFMHNFENSTLNILDSRFGTPVNRSTMKKSILISSKSKNIKPKNKHKHFKLFKKRNLNSKLEKEFKYDFTRTTPNRARPSRKHEF